MKILILEDNVRLCQLMKESLENENYKVDVFMDGDDALDAISNGYQCFILDINVPSLDGISILKTIRIYHSEIPVIIISANCELDKIKLSYEVGCNDYLKKPFFMYELIQKVKKLCIIKKNTLDLGEGYFYTFSLNYLENHKNEKIILAKKEILLLELLAQNEHRVVSYEDIEEYVWEGDPTTFINIRALVKRLRKKLPESAIKIIRGMGYSLGLNCSCVFREK